MLLASAQPAAVRAADSCGHLLPRPEGRVPRTLSEADLIEMREIGYPDAALNGESPLAVSPDGKQVAFVLSRADVASNSYCRGLVVVSLVRGESRFVDQGGEFIPLETYARGLRVDVGLQRLVTPAWSPDGRSIAVLRRDNGLTQAIVVDVATAMVRRATRSATDVEAAWWGDDRTLIFNTRPSLVRASAALEREGQAGWVYDARWAPNYGPRPRLGERDAPLETFALSLADGSVRRTPPRSEARPDEARSASGRRACADAAGSSPFAPQRLRAIGADGVTAQCEAQACVGAIAGIWWSPDEREIWFLKHEGWNGETSAFYRWRVGSPKALRALATTDAVQNCVPAGWRIVCTSESATKPRHVVLLDPATGRLRTVFDPNPAFASKRLGTVRRLRWRNDRGLPAWGDLVLPPSFKPGNKLPLVIVQYQSRGFLRGGTGDEYPIFLLAQRGFAVLSFDRPPPVASLSPGLKSAEELNAANERGWAERRSIQSALLAGVDATIATGWVDPRRVGITGLSDGATAARFAIINSKRFAAAAISSCCLEPQTVMTYGGIAWARFNRAVGYPPATRTDPSFWKPVSMVAASSTLRTPLLMQLSDDEYLLALEAFTALSENKSPVEMVVFPDEHHVKWQPAHRMAIYRRNLDWFDFWLRCRPPASPADLKRWGVLRNLMPLSSRLCG